MENVPSFLKKCFKPQPWPPVLEQYLEYVKALEFHTDPDYSKLRYLPTHPVCDSSCVVDPDLDPGSGAGLTPYSGSGILFFGRIPTTYFSELSNNFLGEKYINSLLKF
jgi:hypothetical protein